MSLWLLWASWHLLLRVPSFVLDVAASRGSCRWESCFSQGPGRAAEPADAAGFAAGTATWFAGGGSSLFLSSLGASSIAPSASSTMKHSRV